MKQLFAFSLLFCLVFLNVPRSFVHNCEHPTHSSRINNDHHDNHEGALGFEVNKEYCFICEFDLGFFNLSEVKTPSFALFINYTFTEPSVEYMKPDEFNAFSHRGPPAA